MSMTDPIADLLTRLRNGAQARKEYVDCPWSKIKESIARVLVDEGFMKDSTIVKVGAHPYLRVWLCYDAQRCPVVTGLKRVSRPSLRVYVGAKSIPEVRRGMGINILSTPAGVLADRDARRRNVGGEIICAVW